MESCDGQAFSAGFDLEPAQGSGGDSEHALREELTRDFDLIRRWTTDWSIASYLATNWLTKPYNLE